MRERFSFRDVIELLFLPLMSAAIFFMYDLSKSMNTMNVQLGVQIAMNGAAEKRLDKHDMEIEELKKQRTCHN